MATRLAATIRTAESRYVVEKTDLNSSGDGAIQRTTYYDQLGRVRQTQDKLNDTVQTLYYTPQTAHNGAPPCSGSAAYSFQLTSSPFVTGSETSMGWTRTGFDRNGRTVEAAHFVGSAMPCPWHRTAIAREWRRLHTPRIRRR